MQRLSKILAQRGVASRREAETIIEKRRVKVNNTCITLPQFMVDEKKDIIKVDNKIVPPQDKKVYFVLNKPKGYLCTSSKNIKKIK